MKIRDLLERVLWTFVASFLGALAASPLLNLDVSALESAALAGLSAVVNVVLVVARARLSVLPDPGAGLPGLPTG